MIRAVTVLSLLALLVLVLYMPSAQPPERFIGQLRAEHAAALEIWGAAAATRMLDRALRMQDSTAAGSPAAALSGVDSSGLQSAVAVELRTVNQRLFDNAYFRSVDALLLLASYRVASLLEWLPGLLAFALAAFVDGGLVRLVKAKEFRQHDPEMYALWSCLGIVTACAAMVSVVLPVTLPAYALPAAAIVLSLLFGKALASFHRRG